MTGSSHSVEALVLRTSFVSNRQQHVLDVLAAWYGLTIEVKVSSDRAGVSSLECESGFKWIWRDHEVVHDGTSLAAEVKWGIWQDDTHGVTLMLPCWTSQNGHVGLHLADGESHLDFDPLGVTFLGVTCWAEQRVNGLWMSTAALRQTICHGDIRKGRRVSWTTPSPCEINITGLGLNSCGQ